MTFTKSNGVSFNKGCHKVQHRTAFALPDSNILMLRLGSGQVKVRKVAESSRGRLGWVEGR